ELAGIGALTV
nr:Chain C, Melanoma peptide L7A [synthetic construct]